MSNTHTSPFTVAVAQVAPVFMDRAATVEKACELIVDAGLAGARLITFPSAFLAGYPLWVWTLPPGEQGHLNELYADLLANAISIPGQTTDRLCRIAQRARVNVVIGLNECETEAGGTACYNTLLYIDAQGQILGKHRSLLLAGAERLVWTPGDGSTLQVHGLPIGIVSGLLGMENYLPLARSALYAWGTQLYIASAWEHGETWLATLRHIAREGGVFVLGCSMALHTNDVPENHPVKQFSPLAQGGWLHPGGSVIVNPDGVFIAGPLQDQEAILYAEIDPRQVSRPRWIHDARPDVFHLTIQQEPYAIVQAQERQPGWNGEDEPGPLLHPDR
jgi:nitrilase